jgi:hypothetical protein
MLDLASRHRMAKEPCAGCGEETAAGSVFYSDRHEIPMEGGESSFLCTLCDARVRSSRRGKPLTDDEVRNLVGNGSLAGSTWWGGPFG